MKGLGSVLAAGAGLLQAVSALTPITIRGNAFFNGTDRFYVRGVDYQPGGSSLLDDPLANTAECKRDIAEFVKLGINTVRVYTVDNTASHDECMKALSDAGIYLILDVNSPLYSINRQEPAPSYNDKYLQSVFATMEMFAKYDNTMAFFSGNEVINETTESTECAPYIKAVTRDMKQFLGNRKMRAVPVGYSAADVSSNRYETAQFLNCGTDDERSDFFAFNDYSWCDSDYKTSGWDKKVELFSNYSIPIFLSEYGCNTNERNFNEVKALYGTDMTPVYSGGLVYEYSQEDSNYGLVQISGNSVKELKDFDALMKALHDTPQPSGDGGYKTNNKPANCPEKSKTWSFSGDSLPALPDGARKFMTEGAGQGPGLKGNNGAGSQNAGGESTATATAGSGKPTSTATGGGSGSGSGGGSSSSGAATNVRVPELSFAPLYMGFVLLVSGAFGMSLL